MAETPSCAGIDDLYARSMDSDVWVRIRVAEDLTYWDGIFPEAVFDIACRLARDRTPVPAHLDSYIYHIQNRPEALLLCRFLFETRGRDAGAPLRDAALCAAVNIAAHAALIRKHPGFSRLFWRIVRDDSYNYAVKNRVAFLCKDFLADAGLFCKTLKVYGVLLDSPDPHVRNGAEVFLFRWLVSGDRHCLPEIRPMLEKASGMAYSVYPRRAGLVLVEYLAKFWKANPVEFAQYIERLCRNNLDTIIYNAREQLVLETIEDMLQSGLLDIDARQRLYSTRARFGNAARF